MFCDAPLADTEHADDGEDWCDFSSSKALNVNNANESDVKTTSSSSLDRLSAESFKFSAESLEALVSSFDSVVAKCLRTSISLDGIVPAPRIRHLDDLVEEECGNSYFSAFLTPNYLERLANVKWSECRTRALFVDSMHRFCKGDESNSPEVKARKKSRHRLHSSENGSEDSEDNLSITSETPSSSKCATPADGDLHTLMVTSVAASDFNETQPIESADDVINEIEEMMRAQEEAGEISDTAFDSFYPVHLPGSSNEIALIDDAVTTVDSGYDVSMTSSAFSVLPPGNNISEEATFNANLTAKLKPLPVNSFGLTCCSGATVNGKFVAQSPQHSDEVVQLFLSETLEEMSLQELERHAETLEVAIRKYSDVLVEELAARDEQVDLKETRDNFVGLVMTVQRRVRDVSANNPSVSAQLASNIALNCSAQNIPSDKKRNSPFVTTVIPFNPDAGPLSLDELRVLAKILQAMLDDSPSVPTLLTEYILTVLCAKEHPRL